MRLLFTIDPKDYDPNGKGFVRDSARAVIVCGEKVAMVHSLKYDYYKFPGGGIEPGETLEDAVIRETREEAGLEVIPESVREFGYVHRIQKSDIPGVSYFKQDNFYFLCEVKDGSVSQELDDYESDERFTPEFVEPRTAIAVNRAPEHGPKDRNMLNREARVLEMLIEEGYIQ